MTTPISSGITERYADFSLALRYEDLPPEVIADARNGLLDTLGVALVGSSEQATRMILNVSAGGTSGGSATVLGADALATPTVAALVNGYAAHALDYDDTQHNVGTHMSAPVLPAALAMAEILHRSGKDLLTAYIGGIEIGCRLARGAQFGLQLHHHGI